MLNQHERLVEEQRDKDELFKQVGRAIVTLSNIENLTAMAFATVSQGMTLEEACALFDSYQSFDQKFRLVGYAIRQNDWGNEFTAWEALSKRLQGQKFVRNLAAHQRMQFKQAEKNGRQKVVLTKHWYKKKVHSSKDLEIVDVKAAADTLETIHEEMWDFIKSLGPETD
jgi:hypothetical protein